MELRKGYKQSELGKIPEDWEVVTIGECFEFKNGLNKAKEFFGQGTPIVNYMDVYKNAGIYSKDLTGLVTLSKDEIRNYEVKKGDVFFTRTSETVDEIGVSTVALDEMPDTVFSGFVLRGRPKSNRIALNYKKYCFSISSVRRQIISTASYTTRALTNGRALSNVKLALPKDDNEQTAIATALSDMDDLINNLSTLIEKKKAIKQGAMQQLLKPKEGWVEISILQLADNKKELFDDGDWVEAEHITNEGIRLIQTGNIGVGCYEEKDTKKYISEASFYKLKCKELRLGDLLICRLAEPAGRACVLPDIGESKIITSVDVTIFRPRQEVANRIFLANIFSTNEWFETVSGMSGGTTHKRISRGALGRIKLSIPSIEEQNKIAYILSDMDNEIQSLEQNLSKYQMLKQGMMQELLTGKTRLV